jgi:hypothetical protein
MPVSVHIAVYEVSDERDPNHWAIFLHANRKGSVILQVSDDKGGVGYYVEKPMYNKRPQNSTRHKTSIEVGSIASEDYEAAVMTILSTPVDNDSQTWNCQAWAMEALDGLEANGMFSWNPRGKRSAEAIRQHWQ